LPEEREHFAAVTASLALGQLRLQGAELNRAFAQVKRLPMEIEKEPYADVIWLTSQKKMAPQNRPLARNLLLYMLDVKGLPGNLKHGYARLLGVEERECEFPPKVYRETQKVGFSSWIGWKSDNIISLVIN
jgi:hypothetical protein